LPLGPDALCLPGFYDDRLRGILEAVRAHRVQDDLSEKWSYAREGFERKLHRKRAKIKVKFMALTDMIPAQGLRPK